MSLNISWKDVWTDPVGSKVIAQCIIAVAALLLGAITWWFYSVALAAVIGVVALELILWFFYRRKGQVIYGDSYYYPESRRKQVRYAMFGVLIMGFTALGAMYLWPSYSDRKTNERFFTIAVARFENPEQPSDRQYRVTRYILDELRGLARKNSEIRIVELPRFIDSPSRFDEVKREAERIGASIVLWGDFSTTGKAVVISASIYVRRLVNTQSEIGVNSTHKPAELADLEYFKLQQDLSKRMTGFVLFILSIVRSANHDLAGSIAALDEALRDPDPGLIQRGDLWFMKGTLLNESGRYAQAEESLTSALKMNPLSEKAYHNRGISRRRQGRLEEAIEDYSNAISLAPKYSLAYLNRGYARKQLNNLHGALDDYNIAITLEPKDARYRQNRFVLCHQLPRWDLIESDVTALQQMGVASADHYQMRAQARLYYGRIDEGFRDYAKAIALDPKEARYRLNRANAFRGLGDSKQALEDLNKSLQLRPDYARAYGIRAMLLIDLSRFSEAEADRKMMEKVIDRSDPFQVSTLGSITESLANAGR